MDTFSGGSAAHQYGAYLFVQWLPGTSSRPGNLDWSWPRERRAGGVVASGNIAQLQLKLSTAAMHPKTGEAGDLFVDKSNRLWLCQGRSQWTKLAL